MLDLGVARHGSVLVILQQPVVGELKHWAVRAVSRKHKGGRQRIALEPYPLRVA
jgi:hypothetical protein